jgi:hypothetical protein
MGSALVRFDVRQHARAESISKRAPSTTRTSLRFRINNLQPRTDRDHDDCDKSSNLARSLASLYQYSRDARLHASEHEGHQRSGSIRRDPADYQLRSTKTAVRTRRVTPMRASLLSPSDST